MDDKFQDPIYTQGYTDAIAKVRALMSNNLTPTSLPSLIIAAMLDAIQPPPPARNGAGQRTTSILRLPDPAPAADEIGSASHIVPRLAPPVAAGRVNIVSGVAPGLGATPEQWAAMGALIGRQAWTAKAMFLNGDLTVDGRLAATVFSRAACERCVQRGVALDCKVPRSGVETLVLGGACQVCVEVGGRCTLVPGE